MDESPLENSESLREPVWMNFSFSSSLSGLPKAAVISHLQVLKGSLGLWAFGCTADDIVYLTLPLYHSSGALLGIGGCIELGKFFFSF